MNIPNAITERINKYTDKLSSHPKLQALYKSCYLFPFSDNLIKKCSDGTYFLKTGDIPAMWLRDSTAQITHFLSISDNPEIADIIDGTIRRQFMYIEIDSYANSFNKTANGNGHKEDIPQNHPHVYERKYEIDSLCYPIRLLYLYWKKSSRDEIIKEKLETIAEIIIKQFKAEQHHFELSPYKFYRTDLYRGCELDTLPNNQKGNPVAYTGMTWSGFRPSDDSCTYHYLIPSEMFASVILGYMVEIANEVYHDEALANRAAKLKSEIDGGIAKYAIYDHPEFGKIYAYETDGLGNYNLMDDANVPSLLSLPYLGYCKADDEIYKNTRKFILSPANPYYFEGKAAKGIGSPHTPKDYIWHVSLAMQGLTSDSDDEINYLLDLFETTTAGTGLMHEGFHVDDPDKFTRSWFAWANSIFAEFVIHAAER